MSSMNEICEGQIRLTSKLSVAAPEFRPAFNPNPPDPELEADPPPESPPIQSISQDNLRTFSCGEKIKKNINSEENEARKFDEAVGLQNGELEEVKADDVAEMEGKDGWKKPSNRRQRPQNNSGNAKNAPRQKNNDRLPGEMVTLDNYRRFVVWSSDVDVARRSISQGRLALILMRGVPGSGKTTLARSLQGNGIVCSADEYFQQNNSYQFDPTRLEDAHSWCLQRVMQAVARLVSPVIIDNTNICRWQMIKYVKLAIRNNFDIYFIEPNTPWKCDATECARRNTHGVPFESIERMIQQFEPVTGLRPFVESGILRTSMPKPAYVPQAVAQVTTPDQANVSRSSSSPDVIELKNDNARASQSPANNWGSSDSSSWTNDELSKADAVLAPPPGLQLSASASSMPKAQREQRPSSQTDGLPASPSMKAQEAKKSDTPTRRKRPDGYGGLAFGLSATPWQLPNDLVGGLMAAKEKDPVPERQLVPMSPAQYREICVRDGFTQVSEKHLTLSNLQHRRLSRQSVDGCEFELEERTVKKESGPGSVLSCDSGIQCDLDGNLTSTEEDGHAKAMATLRSCFPQVEVEDMEDILAGCSGQLEWAVNVLLDSGYDLDWSTKEAVEKETPIETEWNKEDGSMKREIGTIDQDTEAEVNGAASSKNNAAFEASGIKTSQDIGAAAPPFDSDGSSSDGECPLYPMELSVDMAKELQRTFMSIYPDIPPDLLGPSQLKVRLPHDLAAAIFRCWLDTQANNGGDSDYFSEDASFSDEVLGENYQDLGKSAGASCREDDVFAIERQIVMDEQFARQLAAEEENEHVNEPSQATATPSVSSMASQLKLKRLHELFPSVDRAALKGLFAGNNCHMDKTIDMLSEMYDVPKRQRTGSPGRGYATRAAQKPAVTREEAQASDPNEPQLTYKELRQEAVVHYEQRQANYKKAQEYYRKGMASVAYYYSQRGHHHDVKYKEANERAAAKILQQRKAANPSGVLDLHGLHVQEAIHALIDLLRENENRPRKEIKIITGQGLHSANGAKIKPAVTNFLRQHGYTFSQSTPGVFVVTIK